MIRTAIPDGIDYIIPANDDAIKAIKVICSHIADAVLEGKMLADAGEYKETEAEESETDGNRRYLN